MSRPRSQRPKYCLHKSSGRAYVTLDGKEHYLGIHNTPESRQAYHRLLATFSRSGMVAAPGPESAEPAPLSVEEVASVFWAHARRAYPVPVLESSDDPEEVERRRKKRPAGELGNCWDALRPLLRLFGSTSTEKFGPLALKSVREEMLRLGWCRNVVNRQVSRVKHVFKWAAEEELVSGAVAAGIWTVRALRAGHPGARDTENVKPVPDEYVQAVLPQRRRHPGGADEHLPHPQTPRPRPHPNHRRRAATTDSNRKATPNPSQGRCRRVMCYPAVSSRSAMATPNSSVAVSARRCTFQIVRVARIREGDAG